jgi:PAS domain S-box-containing protein
MSLSDIAPARALPLVLVVEDNPVTRKMVRCALEVDGFEVSEAGDGRTALAQAGARRPDLLICDYVLPDTDGVSLLAEVRRRARRTDLPAVVITGMVSRLEQLRAQADGSSQFLAKPVEPSRLLEVVRAQLAPLEPHPAGGRRVLVVDDEPANRKLMAFRLRQAGYEVVTATGAAEGLALARHRLPDAIITDVMMPGMDGFTFCREARRDARLGGVPVLLVSSAFVEDADRELALKMGANDLIARTPDLCDLAAALEWSLRTSAPQVDLSDEGLALLHGERLRVQLEHQVARNEILLRQAAVQATALSLMRGLSEVLAQPKDLTGLLGDVLVHCLDAAGLSVGLLYMVEPDGRHRLHGQFGVPKEARGDAEACFGHPELLRRILDASEPVALGAGDVGDTTDFLSRLGHRSALVVPFAAQGQPFGELVLASDSQELTESPWIAFARSISAQFGQTAALGHSIKRLAESEARHRALTAQANDAVLILDLPHRIVEANRAAERILGRPRSEIVGREYDEFVAPEERLDSASFRSRLEAEGAVRVEKRHFLRPDGVRVPTEVSASRVRVGGDSEEALILVLLRDVTEQERAQAALRAVQDRLAHVVSSSPAVLYALDFGVPGSAQIGLTWISPNVERLLGYSVEEAMAPNWWRERIHPDDVERVLAEVASGLPSGLVEQEYRFRRKGGDYRWMRAEMSVVRDAAGQPVEVVGSWADVSARKQVEFDLVDSEEEYRLLFESNPHPMWVYDLETLVFLAVNDAALRHYGYTRDEWLAMTALDIRPPEEIVSFKKQYEDRMAQPHADFSSHAFKHRKKDGSVIEVEVAANAIVFEGRKARLVLATDVTAKRTLEAQLLQAQKMESIGRLAGGVAHDFNNLLGVIGGYGEMLRKRVAGEPRLKKYAEDILKAADRAAGLTRQLLAFSRKQVLQPRILDLNAVVGELEKMLRRLIGEDIRLVTVLDGRLGPVKADPGQMEQVLMNLAVNARDAMPQGGRLTIETRNVDLDRAYTRHHPNVPPGRYAMLAVSDTGHGMTKEVKARIFEPFFTTKEAGKGTGLGLATVHGVVTQTGGQVFVYSEVGRGTTFKIYIPRADEAEAADESRHAEVELPRGSETVLLVEDEQTLRELVAECLESAGYTVLKAGHGAEALRLSQEHEGPIHLLVTDVVMPGMSGRELAGQVREARQQIRTLYMSGYTDDAVVLHGVLTEGMAFLQKPFTEDGLARKVREVIDARG